MPVIMKECPALAAVVDNGIGYGRKHATEYGARDRVKHRQYNSWTEEALATAAKDGAEVWSFNYMPSRLAFGFLQQRLNSKGHPSMGGSVGCQQFSMAILPTFGKRSGFLPADGTSP